MNGDEKEAVRKLVNDYVESLKDSDKICRQLNRIYGKMDNDNQIFGIIPTKTALVMYDAIKMLVGSNNLEWLMWWCYELDFGKNKDCAKIWIDDVETKIKSVDDVIDICFN